MRREQCVDKNNKNNTVDNLKIRPEESKDYSKIAQVNKLEFGQENEEKLIEKIRNSDRFIPELSLGEHPTF